MISSEEKLSEMSAEDSVRQETPIWRYMDLQRFVAILVDRRLWFTKAAVYEDPYEAFCDVIRREISLADRDSWRELRDIGGTRELSADQMFAHFGELSADYFENVRDHLHMNSWCLSGESMAMWEIYGSGGRGVAIQSTIGQYRRAAKFEVRPQQYAFCSVKYHDDIISSPDLQVDLRRGPVVLPGVGIWEKTLQLAFHKRRCFEYEREWRAALYQDNAPERRGCTIDCDLDELIGTVYVGPRAEGFLLDVVKSLMEKYEIIKPVVRSTLLHPLPRLTGGEGVLQTKL